MIVAQKLHGIFVADLAEMSSATAPTTAQTTMLMKTSLTSYADLATKELTTDTTYTIASESKHSCDLPLIYL